MKAMILAAGLGTRMRPLTDHTPKPLLRAGGKTLIDYHIEKLVAAGITDLIVNCSWLAEQLEAYLGDGHRFGVNIVVSREDQPLETCGGIVQALPFLCEGNLSDEPFLLINGDIWTDFDFKNLISCKPDAGHLVMIKNPAHNPHGDFVLASDGLLAEKDGHSVAESYTFSGISVWRPSVFSHFSAGKRALKPVMLNAISKRSLSGELYEGHWWDIGTPERLAALHEFLSIKTGS
nr:nucleotidyltransferase family protein [Marortus sp. BJYM1]